MSQSLYSTPYCFSIAESFFIGHFLIHRPIWTVTRSRRKKGFYNRDTNSAAFCANPYTTHCSSSAESLFSRSRHLWNYLLFGHPSWHVEDRCGHPALADTFGHLVDTIGFTVFQNIIFYGHSLDMIYTLLNIL